MPTVKVPLANGVYSGVDQNELSDRDYKLINGYIDELGYTVKRPGLFEALDLGETGSKVDGLFWWPQKGVGLATCNNKVFKLTYSVGTLSATNITTNALNGSGRPSFTIGNDGNVSTPTYYALIANGGSIIEGNGTGATISNFATIADADAPTTVSHLDFVDGYVLATTGKNTFQNSDLLTPTSWSALSFASAMRNPDDVTALKVFKHQIFLFGNSSTETWENDGVTPFSPTPGGFSDTGSIAPFSPVKTETSLVWLNSERRFSETTSGEIKTIVCPFDREIARFSDPTDCFSYYMNIGGKPFVLFNFPSDNRTFAYNLLQSSWVELSLYNSTGMSDDRFLGESYLYSPTWGVQLVGSRQESKIYFMSNDYKDDAGQVIRVKKVTGHIDYGTTAQKRCKRLRLRLKRGEGLAGSDAKLLLRWNDDNKGWTNQVEVSLGAVGDNEIVREVPARGIYRTRQYEFLVTDSVGFSIGDAEEDIDILGR